MTIPLPHIIKAVYNGISVTVRLHQQNITIKQPSTGRNLRMHQSPCINIDLFFNAVPQLTVPAIRSLVYDLRERIYHNKEKVMTRRDIPAFAHSSFSSEPADRKLFPQTVVQSKNQVVNMEVIDPALNVKLRHYFSRSQYSGSTVESASITF